MILSQRDECVSKSMKLVNPVIICKQLPVHHKTSESNKSCTTDLMIKTVNNQYQVVSHAAAESPNTCE